MRLLSDSYLHGMRRNQQKYLADAIAVFTIPIAERL